jgi:predicted RND superfamily exporter protein
MWMILFSFPITLFTYRKLFGITNVSALHLTVVFVVLGISADNIFVLWDAWVQSGTYAPLAASYKKRMAYTYRRAYKAILATSSTTAFAFLSNGFSSLMPISAFGYFAFIIVPINYILIVFYFPCYIIIYENWVRSKEAALASCLRTCFTCRCCCRRQEKKEDEEGTAEGKEEEQVAVKEEELGPIEQFFDTTWNDFVKKFRWPIVIAGLAMAAYAGVRSTEIRGLSKMEEYTPKDHFVMIGFEKILFGFNEGDQA